MLFVGNKGDMGLEERLVLKEDVAEWVFCELPKLRAKVTICLSSLFSFSLTRHLCLSNFVSLSSYLPYFPSIGSGGLNTISCQFGCNHLLFYPSKLTSHPPTNNSQLNCLFLSNITCFLTLLNLSRDCCCYFSSYSLFFLLQVN